MDFFAQQQSHRGTTFKLIILFAVAVIGIVAVFDLVVYLVARNQPGGTVVSWLITATAVTLAIIGGGMLSKTIALRAGGSAVALSVGAVAIDPTTSDPQLRRFVNVVEEMSIASGVPMPRLFVLEQEAGINAFAAGYTPADAAITVTGGALQTLNRDELQGVIGHEFSHILNGDMRLNIRLIGLLNGILLLSLIGLRVLVFGGGGRSDRRGNNAAPMLLFALALVVLGFVGQFFASLIKAAVSRQREWLADASSVQFTRQTKGLEGALKKIAGLPTGSTISDRHGASQVSHMLFGEGGRSFSQLFATHPPLLDRIKALDPQFDPRQVQELAQKWSNAPPNGRAEDAAMGLTGRPSAPASPPVQAATQIPAATPTPVVPAAVTARVGSMTPADLAHGAELSAQIPPRFRQLASQASTAVPLVLAMMVNPEPDVRAKQFALVQARLGHEDAVATAGLADEVHGLAPQLRLPVLAIASPLVTARPRASLDALVPTLDDMALADGRVSLFEYCLTRLVASYIKDANDPPGRSKPGRAAASSAQDAAFTLLAALAATGNDDPAAAERAFAAAVTTLLPGQSVPYAPPGDTWHALDRGWSTLDAVAPAHKQRLVQAMVVAVRDDGVLTLHEAELLRTACGLLHCPMPSFVA
ncbi:MAG: M48 family metalloprotease [Jatrophihabitantaceae bacterium]